MHTLLYSINTVPKSVLQLSKVSAAMAAQENDISWALKLLEREPEYEPNLLAKNWAYICGTLTGLALPLTMNAWLRRPIWAGIQRHVICSAAGFGVGHLLTEREKFALARRDAIMRDYIQQHPEDFPPPERKKYKDLFERWVPVR